jgi:hypothetical protein
MLGDPVAAFLNAASTRSKHWSTAARKRSFFEGKRRKM